MTTTTWPSGGDAESRSVLVVFAGNAAISASENYTTAEGAWPSGGKCLWATQRQQALCLFVVMQRADLVLMSSPAVQPSDTVAAGDAEGSCPPVGNA